MIAMLLGAFPVMAETTDWSVTDLQCNALTAPLNVDAQNPTLSWRMEASHRGAKQTAFQVVVKKGETTVWDSGKVESDACSAAYAGETLVSTTAYDWTVTVWNESGASRSASSVFETAFFDPAKEFTAEMISAVEKSKEFYDGDYTLEYTFKLSGTAAGFIFSAADSNTFYSVLMNSANSKGIRVLKTSNATNTFLLQPTVAISKDISYKIKIKLVGTTGTIYLNDTTLGEFTDSALGFGKFGFRHMISDSDSAYYDDLKITAADGTVLLQNDFSVANPFGVGTLTDGQLYVPPITSNWRIADSIWSLEEMLENENAGFRYSGDYTVRYEVQIANHAAGFIFAGTDVNNNVAVQLNAKSNPMKAQVIRCNGGSDRSLGSWTFDGTIEDTFKVQIDVVGTTATVSVNEIVLGSVTDSTIAFGVLGFRHFNTTDDQESGYYDHIEVTDSEGAVLYETDFSDGNPFGVGTVENGRLLVPPLSERRAISTYESLKLQGENSSANGEVLYTIETDLKVESVAGSVAFGGSDARNLLFWQLNLSMGKATETVYLRPHAVIGGSASCLENVDVSAVIPWAERNDWHRLKIVVYSNQHIETYLNDTLVDSRSHALSVLSQVGFRHSKGEGEAAFYDNYRLTADGKVLIEADFNDHTDPFGTGRTQAGTLYLKRTGLHMRDVEQKGAPLFRTEFKVEKEVASARLYASALGVYESYINGQAVGTEQLAPGWTKYYDVLEYQVYDVTELLQSGDNAIGAVVGNGWYAGHVGEGDCNYQYYGIDVGFKGQLLITYIDGTTDTVVTDESWQVSTESPYLVTDNFNGETYDASREQPGWNTVGFQDADWKNAVSATDPSFRTNVNLKTVIWQAQSNTGVQVYDTITPKTVTKVGEDAYIFDMGQNFAGVVTLKATGVAGQTVRLRYGEALYNEYDGELEGQLFTENLRTAFATDYYIFGADGTVTYTPAFTFHGFQYVEVSGLGYEPSLSDLIGVVWSSLTEVTSSLETSDDLVDQIYSNALWGQLSNYLAVPTDCPQRDERLGFSGDTQVFVGAAVYNSDIEAFLDHFMEILANEQGSGGGVPNTAPSTSSGKSGSGGTPGWADGIITIPYTLYETYGDIGILRENYASMQSWITNRLAKAGYASTGNLMIRGSSIGDWLATDSTPYLITNSAYFALSLDRIAKVAELLGKAEDAVYYRNLLRELSDQYKQELFSSDGRMVGDTQTAYALTLYSNVLMDEALEQRVADRLAEKVKENGMKLSVGFLGVNALAPMLSKYGHSDVVYALVQQTEYPSWGYSVSKGATTIWERWNGMIDGVGMSELASKHGSTMNSFNHYAYGAIVEWMFEYMAGIQADIEDPGYHHIVLAPEINSALESVNASYDSAYGKIVSHWDLNGDSYTWTVTVPANAYATVYAPGVADVDDMTCVTQSGNVFEIQSGTYTFTGTLTDEGDVRGLESELDDTDLVFYQKHFEDTDDLAKACAAASEYLKGGRYTAAETETHMNALKEAKAAFLTPGSYVGERIAISSVAEWLQFAATVNSGETFAGKTVTLTCDLDFEGFAMKGVGCYSTAAFEGTFDGQYHMLKNVNIVESATGVGIFNYTNGAVIKNLGVSGSVTGPNVVGGLVGYADGGTVIVDCWNEARVMAISGVDGVAGIAGNARHASSIDHSYNVGVVIGKTNVAGLCSWGQSGENAAVISDSYHMGTLLLINHDGLSHSIARYGSASAAKTTDCYYLSSGAGTAAALNGTIASEAAAFTDGTVAAALNMLQGETHPILAEPETEPEDLGIDLNNDGETNAADVTVLLKYLNGGNVAIDTVAADVNLDEKVSLADALRLMKLLSE
ncbi:MAG: family 78 glycoside hydrolase catalytic domain [Clostridia bacterium]|nr:family 78 glycoside hydrolase catalytic domain [Clostridia bacterium]